MFYRGSDADLQMQTLKRNLTSQRSSGRAKKKKYKRKKKQSQKVSFSHN